MSVMRYSVAVKRPCVKYMMTGENVINGEKPGNMSVVDTKMNRRRLLEIRKNNTGSVQNKVEVAQNEEG